MDTLRISTAEGGWSLCQALQALKRGLDLIDRTRSRDDRRVMLGFVFKDLDALRSEISAAPSPLREGFVVLEARALAWRAKLGAPVAPDAVPESKPVLRVRRRRTFMIDPAAGIDIPTLTTERLRLRPFRKSDLDDYAALHADREVLRFLGAGPEPWDRGRSSRHLAFLLGHWQVWGAGMWALEHKENGAFLGMVGFASPEGWPGFELAWTLARRYWGQGYATEGARAAMDHAFTVWKRDRIISLIYPANQASVRVAERIGERLEGRIMHLGREMLCYGLDRGAYLQKAAPVGAMSASAI